ncbi:MAG: response regulator transcription factor [Bacteroidetes bacterium]|nr:response regulator transcription factor [Bacteroidota bacterium]
MDVIIIEDERRAANMLERLIGEVDPSMIIVAKLESVRESVEFLRKNRDISLIFSDIQLGDGLSFEIFEKTEFTCPIIFTTAYDQYAINAFKANGIDYLLKPVKNDDLEKAITKYKHFSKPAPITDITAIANLLLERKSEYKSRFMIKVGEKIKVIPVEDIPAFYSMEKATFIFTSNQRNYVIDYSLDHLQTLLNPERFFRINRKYIVSLDYIDEIIAWSNSRLKIKITGLEEENIIVARDRTREFKEWLGE